MVSEVVQVVPALDQASPVAPGTPKTVPDTAPQPVVMPAVIDRPYQQSYRETTDVDGSIRRSFVNEARGSDREGLTSPREAIVAYRPDRTGGEVVVQISKVRDQKALPQARCELLHLELKVQALTDNPYQKDGSIEVFESATQHTQSILRELDNPRSKVKPDVQYARLISTLRGLADGRVTIREISAANIGLTFEASERAPLLLVGLRLKECGNLTIKGERTSTQEADGLFSVRAPYMIIDGGFGGIEICGVDCSKVCLMNLRKRQDSKIQFRECQLRGAHTRGECGVGTFSCWDCSFGEVARLGDLRVSQPASNLQDFSIYFGGSVSSQDCAISLPTELATEEVKGALTGSPHSFAARMLKPLGEASLADLIQNSSLLAPSLLSSYESERVYQVCLSQDDRLEVVCRRYPELPGWRIATLSASSNTEGVSKIEWSRGPKVSALELRRLEERVDEIIWCKLGVAA